METITRMTVLSWILLGAGSQTDSALPAPRLSSSLPNNFIIKGEEIPLNCSLPKGVESGSLEGSHRIKFFFRCKDESYLRIEHQFLPKDTFNFKTENLSSGEVKIICNCWIVKIFRGWTYSPESNQLVFSVVDGLPFPVLKVDPLSQTVKEGDPLLFLCSTEGDNPEKKFHFYKDGVEITSSEEGLLEPSSEPTTPLQRASLRIPRASFSHSGEFACSYEEKRSDRWVTSPLSQGTNITVERGSQTDSSLPAPRLSSSLPNNFIIKGEEIPLICSLPKGIKSGSPEGSHRIKFFFYCKDQSYVQFQDEVLLQNTFNFRTEHLESNQIKIICKCKIRETFGKRPHSPDSNQLVFSVVDGLPSPLLKVAPLSRRVKEGDPLLFLCSTEGDNPEQKFHFYKDGVDITSSEEGLLEPSSESTNPLQNASLRIPHALFSHNGEFACSYEEKRSNRWIMSSLSQGTNITVERAVGTQDSDPIWRYSWAAIPLIILLVPLVIYCWKKKSPSASQEQFQFAQKKEEMILQ